MTTIIGIQHDWGVEIHADGQTTDGANRPYRGGAPKVVKRAEYLIAAAGPGAVCDAVTLGWMPPPFTGRVPIWEMVSSVIPHLRTYLSDELGYEMCEDKDASKAELLLAVHGVLYYVAVDGTVLTHHDDVMGIGSGSAYAIGALYAGANIRSAMNIAHLNDVYTGPPTTTVEQVKPGKEKPSAGEPSPDSSPLHGTSE